MFGTPTAVILDRQIIQATIGQPCSSVLSSRINISFVAPTPETNARSSSFLNTPIWRRCSTDSTEIATVQGWVSRRVVSAHDVVNASYLPTTINIYDLEIRSINNYRKSYNRPIASFLVSTTISRRCRFGNSKPCKYIRSSYVRRNCIYDNNRVSANISSYDYR